MELSKGSDKWRIVDGTVWGQLLMEECGRNCLGAVTNGGLWMELSEGSDQLRIVHGLTEGSDQRRNMDGTVRGQ